MEKEIIVVPTMLISMESESQSDCCNESVETATDTSSVSSVSTETEPISHKLSLINILEMSSSGVLSPTDLEEQEDMMSQALSSNGSANQQDRSSRAQFLEKAIKTRKEHKLETTHPAPQRARFTASPSHNANRFCRKPKERASSEGGSPLHTGNGSHNIRIESPCQVSVTSLNANIRLPMDRLSTKLFNPPERSYTSLGVSSPRRSHNGASCFGIRGRTGRQYVIHPDWVSENLSIGKAQLTDRGGSDFIDYMKRSQSCPPPMRNVITWDSKYLSGRQANGNDRT